MTEYRVTNNSDSDSFLCQRIKVFLYSVQCFLSFEDNR